MVPVAQRLKMNAIVCTVHSCILLVQCKIWCTEPHVLVRTYSAESLYDLSTCMYHIQ